MQLLPSPSQVEPERSLSLLFPFLLPASLREPVGRPFFFLSCLHRNRETPPPFSFSRNTRTSEAILCCALPFSPSGSVIDSGKGKLSFLPFFFPPLQTGIFFQVLVLFLFLFSPLGGINFSSSPLRELLIPLERDDAFFPTCPDTKR